MRAIDADALCEEFKRRQRAALRWKEEAILADNEESKIRADAVLTFLSEVKLLIDNAPTVEQPTGEWIYLFTFLDSKIYECNHCKGRLSLDVPQRIEDFKYCNGCGAKMKGGAEI